MRLHKFDELDSLIRGIEFIEANNPDECYYWDNPRGDSSVKRTYDFRTMRYPFMVGFLIIIVK